MTELSTFITLSTAHVPKDLAKMLDDQQNKSDSEPDTDWLMLTVLMHHAFGWMLRVPQDETKNDGPTFEDKITTTPPAIAAAYRRARTYGAHWIMFDRDVEPDPGLELFDW